MAIAARDWACLRIIDIESCMTLSESCVSRNPENIAMPEISNKKLLSGEPLENKTVFSSNHSELTIKAYLAVPGKEIDHDQETLVTAILKEIEMIYLIFSSQYIKKRKA